MTAKQVGTHINLGVVIKRTGKRHEGKAVLLTNGLRVGYSLVKFVALVIIVSGAI